MFAQQGQPVVAIINNPHAQARDRRCPALEHKNQGLARGLSEVSGPSARFPMEFRIMNNLTILSCCITLSWAACNHNPSPNLPPLPYGGEINDDGDPLKIANKKKYLEERYFAAPGTNVDSIRAENRRRNIALKKARQQGLQSRSVSEVFANGQLTATWHERGPKNEAGDMRVIDFVPASEDLYTISTVGHLWKGNLNGQKVTTINSEGATDFTAALERGVYLYQIKSEGRHFSGKIVVE